MKKKLLDFIAKVSRFFAVSSVNACCLSVFYQDEEPKQLKKYRKF